MEFAEILEQVITLLQRQGRVSYGALKRRLKLSDDYLEDLKIELIEAQRLAVDENDRILVWIGDQGTTSLPASQPVNDTEQAPVSYCIATWRTSRRPNSCTRRASSPSANSPSSMPSPTRWPMVASCRSGGACCMPASWRH